MVDYSKWDKLAAELGDDYEKEDEEGKKEWISKWEIENAALQKEWLGEKFAAEQEQGTRPKSLRRQLGLREEEEDAVYEGMGFKDGDSALDHVLKMPAVQRCMHEHGGELSEAEIHELETLACSERTDAERASSTVPGGELHPCNSARGGAVETYRFSYPY